MSKELSLPQKRQKVCDALTRHCREYGTVRIARLDAQKGCDTLVMFSPVVCVPGDVPCVPITVLDPPLWRMMVEGFGSVKVACAFFASTTSYHFVECGEEDKNA